METSERRKDPRENCFMAVDFAFDDKSYTEFIRNISNRGLFIETNMQIPPGRAVLLTYDSPEQGPIKRIGKVVRSEPTGVGLRLPNGG